MGPTPARLSSADVAGPLWNARVEQVGAQPNGPGAGAMRAPHAQRKGAGGPMAKGPASLEGPPPAGPASTMDPSGRRAPFVGAAALQPSRGRALADLLPRGASSAARLNAAGRAQTCCPKPAADLQVSTRPGSCIPDCPTGAAALHSPLSGSSDAPYHSPSHDLTSNAPQKGASACDSAAAEHSACLVHVCTEPQAPPEEQAHTPDTHASSKGGATVLDAHAPQKRSSPPTEQAHEAEQ